MCLPEKRVTRSSFSRFVQYERVIHAVMNRVVRSVRNGDEIVRVQNKTGPHPEIIHAHWHNMMDQNTVVNVIPFNAKIATIITLYNTISHVFPLSGTVESLIDIAIMAKRLITYPSRETEVVVPFRKCGKCTQFMV